MSTAWNLGYEEKDLQGKTYLLARTEFSARRGQLYSGIESVKLGEDDQIQGGR